MKTTRKTGRTRGGASGGRRRASPDDRPRARKRFGQHFLEPAWVEKLIAAIATSADDTFLEVGPGRGALTLALAPRVAGIIAVEIDRDLAAALPSRMPPNVRVVLGDFLRTDLEEVLRDTALPVRVVGNLPYNVASPILFRLLHTAQHGRRFRDATLMLQKEVADRLCAVAGQDGYGGLAIQVSLLADVDRLLTLPPGAFRPAFGNPGLPFMAIRAMSCTVKSVKDDGFPEIQCIFFDRPGAIVSFGENLRCDLGACPGAHAVVSVNPCRCHCGFLFSG
jgi:hypothetical protein